MHEGNAIIRTLSGGVGATFRRQGFSHDISQTYTEAADVACLMRRPGLGAVAALSIAMQSAQMNNQRAAKIADIMQEAVQSS
ncbi:hypothetical protein EPK99_01605 [Neorhizobium lilium]|uniref:Transcriptional regulator n=1 Tax=Neorhizobium lilium TaxID=2503024 RepID=A0A444LL65_9HYPH|nr:hypothetical protein [Neorhizobium lilium]RWX81053.1 hypothetical protein EPK99_01605 [Neorhizobium lilium]